MKKINSKQLITTAFLAAVVGVSGAPLSAGAVGGYSQQHNNSWDRDHNRRDNDRRIISEWQAKRIAQNVFPHKHVVRVVLRGDDGRREYQVRFSDGSRVDVRAKDGRVTFIDNNSRRYSHNNWR